MNNKQIDLEQLLLLHAYVLAQTGGGDGVRDMGRLEAALATQSQEVFGTELYESIFDKAAAIIRGIIADHPFVDGNKRTAMMAGLVLLKVNGAIFCASRQELEDFAVRVATERLSVKDIAKWLTERSN